MQFTNNTLLLYAVTDRRWTGKKSLYEQVEDALRGGVTCVQLREKELDDAAFLKEAVEIKALCQRYDVPLIINDNVDVALACGADGVHLGQNDLAASDVRRRVGKNFIIGVTARTVAQARAAQLAGADYLGSGAIFGTLTKKDALPMTREMLTQICNAVAIPVVAIGGVQLSNIRELAGIPISGTAILSGIFAQQDITATCHALHTVLTAMLNVRV